MDIQVTRPVTTRISQDNGLRAEPLASAVAPNVGATSRIDFESMTAGEYIDTLNYLCQSGQITHEEALDIYVTCIPPTTPSDTEAEHLRMPMRISYDRLRDEIVELTSGGRFENRDRHQRVLDLLIRLDGTPRGVDTTA